MIRKELERLEALAGRIRSGKPGVDFRVVPGGRDWEGYEETDLEREVAECCRSLREEIAREPGHLTAAVLERLIRAALDSEPAVGDYRARLLKAAGDWDDEYSPANLSLSGLLYGLHGALKALEDRGLFPLDELNTELLLRPFDSVPVYRLLADWEMRSRRDLFDRDAEKNAREAGEAVERLRRSQASDRLDAVRPLAGLALAARKDVADRALSALASALGDPDATVSERASEALQEAGDRAADAVVGASGSESARARRKAVYLLYELARAWPPEGVRQEKALSALFGLAKDRELEVARASQECLDRLDGTFPGQASGVIAVLLESMGGDDAGSRRAATTLLLERVAFDGPDPRAAACRRAISVLQGRLPEARAELDAAHRRLAESCVEAGRRDEALAACAQWLSFAKAAFPGDASRLARPLECMASIHERAGEADAAEECRRQMKELRGRS
jgi:hypothetical protein